MNKLITFTVPCYNSAEFMHNCIDSILATENTEDIEIIIINDGSVDSTGEVADRYAANYPGIVRAVHQENGGHGEGVNRGIREASGKYYKVVDSDDRLDTEKLNIFLSRVRENEEHGEEEDMYICNYVYVRTDTGKRRVMRYKNIFPEGKTVSWSETHRFGLSQYLMMHSVVYRTDLLRDHNFELPKHTFYVDNLYMYYPFPYVNRIYYMDLDLYLYYVGRDEQSVNEKNVLKRIDQQLLVAKLMIGCHDLNRVERDNPVLHRYMLHELAMIMSICDVFLYIREKNGDTESVEKQKALWELLKETDIITYKRLKRHSVATLTYLPGGKLGRRTTVAMYRLVNLIYKPN